MFIATLSFIIINETRNWNDRLNSVFKGAVERAAYLIGQKIWRSGWSLALNCKVHYFTVQKEDFLNCILQLSQAIILLLQSGEQCLSCNIFYCRQFWNLTLCLCHVRLLLGKLIWHSEWHLLVHSEILYLFLRIQIRYAYRRSPQIQPCVLFPHTKNGYGLFAKDWVYDMYNSFVRNGFGFEFWGDNSAAALAPALFLLKPGCDLELVSPPFYACIVRKS